MFKRLPTPIVAVLLALLTGCALQSGGASGGGASLAPLAAAEVLDLDPARFGSAATGHVKVRIAWPRATARTAQGKGRRVQAFPASTTDFRLTVSATDMTSVVLTVSRPQGADSVSASMTVPAGSGRTLLAEGLNAEKRVTARGTVRDLTVDAGAETAVTAQLSTVVGDVTGTVYSVATRQPVANLPVAAGGADSTTDAAGNFTLSDVAAGSQYLHFTAAVVVSQPIEVPAGGTLDAGPVGVSVGYTLRGIPNWGCDGAYNTGVAAKSDREVLVVNRERACNQFSRVWRSTDRGDNWDSRIMVGGRITDIRYAGGDYAYFTTDQGKLYRSTDSGYTWLLVNHGVNALRLHPLEAATILTAGAGGECPNAAALNLFLDGGIDIADCHSPPARADSLWAFSQSDIWLKSAYGQEFGDQVFRTEDGGATWVSSMPGVRAYGAQALAANGPGNAVVVGEGAGGDAVPTIAETTDGGATWSIAYQDSRPSEILRAVVPLGTGWVTAGLERVLVRYPGTSTWANMATPGLRWEYLSFPPAAAGGFAVDGGLTLARF